MRRRYVGLAVVLAATAVAGMRVVTDAPGPATTVRVEGPSQPLVGPAAGLNDPAASAAPLSLDELMRQGIERAKSQRFCAAPPITLTDEQKQAIERTLSTLPVPPTIPGATPGAATAVQRLLVPC